MAAERIQKVLSEQGFCSRRAAEELIKAGRVKVNGHPAALGDKVDVRRDALSVDEMRRAGAHPDRVLVVVVVMVWS